MAIDIYSNFEYYLHEFVSHFRNLDLPEALGSRALLGNDR